MYWTSVRWTKGSIALESGPTGFWRTDFRAEMQELGKAEKMDLVGCEDGNDFWIDRRV